MLCPYNTANFANTLKSHIAVAVALIASLPKSHRFLHDRLADARVAAAAALAAGALLFAAPAFFAVVRDAWTYGNGAHMLFILGGGCWLLFDALRSTPRQQTRLGVTLLLLLPVIALYLLGRITSIAWLGWIAVCAAGLLLVRDHYGWSGVARAAIPLALLAGMAPPPIGIVAPVSDGIIAATAQLAIWMLSLSGIDAAIATPMLYINQYELQLAEACAGLNTVFTLSVCMILYAYLRHRGHWRRALLLTVLAVPIALFANLLRILAIAAVIVIFGEACGQGMVHELAGVTLFAIALFALIAIDQLLDGLRR